MHEPSATAQAPPDTASRPEPDAPSAAEPSAVPNTDPPSSWTDPICHCFACVVARLLPAQGHRAMSDNDTMEMVCFATVREDGTQTLHVAIGPLSPEEAIALSEPAYMAVHEVLTRVLADRGIKIIADTREPDLNRETNLQLARVGREV